MFVQILARHGEEEDKAAFIAKLNDSETEATETQVWLELALLSGYITEDVYNELFAVYESITAQLVIMINQSEKWIIVLLKGKVRLL